MNLGRKTTPQEEFALAKESRRRFKHFPDLVEFLIEVGLYLRLREVSEHPLREKFENLINKIRDEQ